MLHRPSACYHILTERASQAIVLVLYFVVLTEPASIYTMKTQSQSFPFRPSVISLPCTQIYFLFSSYIESRIPQSNGDPDRSPQRILQLQPAVLQQSKTSRFSPTRIREFLDLPTYVSSLRHNGRIALIDSAIGKPPHSPSTLPLGKPPHFPNYGRASAIKSLAAGLAGLGIRKSDVVLILSRNSIYFPIICMAVLSIGAIVTTTNPLNTAAEIGVKSLAAGLASLGVRKSDVVLILLPNSIYFPIICMVVLSIGAIVTATNPLNTAAEIAKQARDSTAVLAFAMPSLAVKLAIVLISSSSSELASQNDQNYISTLDKLLTSNPAHAPVVKVQQDDTVTLLYSSGTTGMSNVVISTH